MSRIDTILVANRGEIALRVMRTARALGRRTVAVFSDADRDAPHVRAADAAVHIGPSPVAQSYLDGARIIEAARAAGADAIHPGYGFLSENADFARACAEAGLVFIGPPADAIALMGNKAAAKRRMMEAGVPCVPGYEGAEQDDATFAREAERIGFPVMVKAAAGGGGRGMRLVADADALPDALATARSEAENAFGSGELILEKAVARPRHVEIQVFADGHGNVIHLAERDCSVQRRHQKVIEEAPCPVMTPQLRAAMGAAAVEAARAISYRGAGTVEFLLDDAGQFYFLEMNTRLQVEHPVTEMITGLDLVALQIAVAEGAPLGLAQDDVALDGHAIEARLYAEDPTQGFLPSTGRVDDWRPAAGEGVRIDAGIEAGQDVSPFYDPMIAKVIVHGPDRDTARRRLAAALRATVLSGPRTNKAFLVSMLENDVFAAGQATTAFIPEQFGEGTIEARQPQAAEIAAAAVLLFLDARDRATASALGVPAALLDWSSNGRAAARYDLDDGANRREATVKPLGDGRYGVVLNGEALEIAVLARGRGAARLETGSARLALNWAIGDGGAIEIDAGDAGFVFRDALGAQESGESAAGGRVEAPMHGRIAEILVGQGDAVAAGARLAVLEAMKMQHAIEAAVDGTVAQIACKAGDQVGAGDLILEIEPKAEPGEG